MEDELNRMLSAREEIVPSSGFVSSVMDAVRLESAAEKPAPLSPISFPWLRALPVFASLAGVVAMLIAGFVEIVRSPASAAEGPFLPPAVEHALVQVNAGWIAAALLIAFFATLFSVRFAVGKR